MELQELYGLMERFAASGLTELEWRREEESIRLHRDLRPAATAVSQPAASAAPAAAPVPPAKEGEVVKAPLVGVFYAAPAPGVEAFAPVGKEVKKGEALCLIEAMKMMSEVPAPFDCVVEARLVEDGAAVGFGDPMFRVRKV